MTELTITPKIADKTARFKGAVAAGEHVAVTIKGGAAWLGDDNGEHLSLRVLDLVTGRTLAVFPRPPETLEEGDETDEWSASTEDPNDLFCNLNLNTDRMVNAARHMLRVPVLFVMGARDEDNPATTRTLYFRDRHEVEFWPERVGDDTPYDLDRWPKKIDEWTELVAEFDTRLTTAEANVTAAQNAAQAAEAVAVRLENDVAGHRVAAEAAAEAAAGSESSAAGSATEAAGARNDARDRAASAQTSAAAASGSATSARNSSLDAEAWAAGTKGGEAVPATDEQHENNAKYYAERASTTAGALVDAEKARAQAAESALSSAVTAAAGKVDTLIGGDANKSARTISAEEVAKVVASAPADFDTLKEIADWIAGDQNRTAAVVNRIAALEGGTFAGVPGKGLSTNDYTTAEKQKLVGIADGANNYTLPPATATTLGGVKQGTGCEIASDGTLNVTGGGGTVDDTVTREGTNPVKSSGIWSAIWGALAALPTGFTSLYEWCKSFFVHVSAIAPKWDAGGTYRVGNVCMEGELPDGSGLLYRCKKAHTATSESDAPSHDTEHWEPIDVTTLIAGKQDALSAAQLANIAAVTDKASAADLRYTLPETVTTIDTASSEVVSGETVYYGAATLADRTQNQVAVLVALDELRVTIPPAVSGKVRDFGLIVGVGLGEGTALAAPAFVPVAPTGETIMMMNADGEMPTLADGTTTASGFTVLYFTEIGNGTFLVKGEQVEEVA